MRALVFLLLLVSPLLAQTETLKLQPGLIELRIPQVSPDVEADIAWESRQPLDLDYRIYESGSVFVTYGAPGQQLIIASDVILWDARRREKRTWIIQVEGQPVPPIPPEPIPPVPPEPDVPFPSPGLAVLILTEAGKLGELPPSQAAILSSPKVIQYLRDRVSEVNGDPLVRIWDDDYTQDQLSFAPEVFQKAYRDVRDAAAGQLPWLAISDGTTGWQGPLPGSVDDMMALLKEHCE